MSDTKVSALTSASALDGTEILASSQGGNSRGVTGAQLSNYIRGTLVSPPAIGGTTPAAGAFTTLAASSTVSGAGFSTYLASPPAIGGSAPAAGAFTTLSATGAITSTLANGSAPLVVTSSTNVANLNASSLNAATFAAPGAIGSGTPSTGAFTTLTATTPAATTNSTQVATTAYVMGASPRVIFQSGLSIGIPSSGTMGANGAVTLTTAMSVIYARIFLYFPAGKVASGSAAGFYPTVMSSTTVGQVYNVASPLAGGALAWPGVLTAVSDAGPGAYTQDTSIQTAFTVTIPANVIGANGSLTFEYLGSHNNTAGIKTPTVLWGASTVLSGALSTTLGVNMERVFYNRSVTNAQVSETSGTGNSFGTLSVANAQYAIDTTTSTTFTFKLTLAVATDQIICEAVRLVALYGA